MLAPRVDDIPGPRLVANQAGVMIQRDRQDERAVWTACSRERGPTLVTGLIDRHTPQI